MEIHAAHGYLLGQFLSLLTNQRHDQWGRSLDNRAGILPKIVRATQARAGAGYGVAVKL